MTEQIITLTKEINKVGEKTYTNYVLNILINSKTYKIAIMPKTFGKDWTHPQVRQSFTVLDLVSTLIVKDDKDVK